MSILRKCKVGASYGFFGEFTVGLDQASDVYMYEHVHGFIVCQQCEMGGDQNFDKHTVEGVRLFTYVQAHDHLLAHRKAGHNIPQHAIEYCQSCAESGEKLEAKICDVPGCGKFWGGTWYEIRDGKVVTRSTCTKHIDDAKSKECDEWRKVEAAKWAETQEAKDFKAKYGFNDTKSEVPRLMVWCHQLGKFIVAGSELP